MVNRVSVVILIELILFAYIIDIPVIKSFDDPYWYNPEDVVLKDNAYNITDYFALQWWYIDAVFNNNYSINIGILTVGSRGIHGFFSFQINIYKYGEFLDRKVKIVPVRFVDTTQNEPLIKLYGKEIFRGYIDDEERMALDISLDIKDLKTKLKFIGLTKGWKGFTGLGMWGCPLPKASVKGSISINGDTIPVTGIGYQEHAWGIRQLHKSWYWGKFSSKSANVIFSQNMKNRWEEDLFLAVVNSGEINYTSIARGNIIFNHIEYIFDHGRFIPKKSVFQVKEGDIHINVEIEVQSIHFTSLVFLNYWRFHTKVTGTISINGITEEIDDFQIMENFHFL
jgi:hypothetical protein